MSLLTDLVAVRDLLSPEGAWTQGAYARDGERQAIISADDPAAVCWCIDGAIDRVIGYRHHECRADRAGQAISKAAGAGKVGWNDTPGRTQAEVIAMLDRAIEAAK